VSEPVPPRDEEGYGLAERAGADSLLARMSAAARHEDVVATVVITLGLIAAMQIMSFFTPPYVLPSPGTVLAALVELLGRDLRHVGITLARWTAGIAFALAVGSALGVVMAGARRVAPYLRALLFIDTGVPALSWMLLAILWFGNPEARIFFILVVLLLPFYAMNVYEGIKALPPEWVEMVEVFRPSRVQLLRLLVLPHIVPYVILTTKSVVGYAIRMTIFAELIAAAVGVGARMSLAQSLFRIDTVLAWTVLLVVLNFVVQGLVVLVERRTLGWRPASGLR
jgi:NitT/TauT family transport system permease protein